MRDAIVSYLKARWGLEWIRLYRAPITFTVASQFVRYIAVDPERLLTDKAVPVDIHGIGNLSGLIAGSLASLQRSDYGLYNVHYLTQTNKAGGALLNEYLCKELRSQGTEPVKLTCQIEPGPLLEIIGLDRYPALSAETMLARTKPPDRAAYNSSQISTADAFAFVGSTGSEIVNELYRHKETEDTPLLLLYIANNADNNPLQGLLKGNHHKNLFTICMPESIAQQTASESGITAGSIHELTAALSTRFPASFIVHSDCEFVLAQGEQLTSIDIPAPPDQLYLSRFLSGILLSTVTDEWLRRLDGPPELAIDLEDRLVLGYALAESNQSAETFVTEPDLLDHLGLLTCPEETQESESESTLTKIKRIYQAACQQDPVRHLHQLGQDSDELVVSAAVDRLQQINGLERLPALDEERIVFLDLDLTLFDYTAAREVGAKAALVELPTSVPLPQALAVYNEIVSYWEALEMIGIPNLRRVWNADIIYFLVYVLLSKRIYPRINELFSLFSELEQKNTGQLSAEDVLNNSDLGKDFLEALKLARQDVRLQQRVRRAYIRFEHATDRLEPFSETRDILLTLTKMKGYHVFVVTEGYLNIQWEKIEKLRLDDLVTPTNLIATDGLATQPVILNALTQTERQLKQEPADDRQELQLEAVEFFRSLFDFFHYKRDRHFYRHALHVAVSQIIHKTNQNQFANVSTNEWEHCKPIKLASVGDRYTNDILPLVQLLGEERLLSVRMLYGKYINEDIPADSPIPDWTVSSLVSARNFLLQDAHWADKLPIARPTHFEFTIREEQLPLAITGLAMPFAISSICKALLEDYGLSQPAIRKLQKQAVTELRKPSSSVPLKNRLFKMLG